jgi:hypothetical protein
VFQQLALELLVLPAQALFRGFHGVFKLRLIRFDVAHGMFY